jgi:hypothetical protein
MPDSSSELATLGHCPIALVVAVGPECKQIKRGQWIASFPGVGATKIWFEGYSVEDAEHMVMLQEIAIAGIIDDPEKHGLPVYTEDANPQGRRESKSPIRENQERDRGTKT